MPRISKKVPRHRAQLTLQQTLQLLTGTCYIGHERLDGDALAIAWEEWGETLTEVHISLYPCTRPYAWWKFSAPEPRRRCVNMSHPFDDRRYPDHAKRLSYGLPALIFVGARDTNERLWDDAEFETQDEYLQRHKLLTPAERRKGTTWLETWPADKLTQEPYLSLSQVRDWYSTYS